METPVETHYSSENLEERITKGLKGAGKNLDALTLKDLSVIDQLHTGGHLATLALAKTAGITDTMTVLDAGCGIGGTTRLIAQEFGCLTTGIDLVRAFVDTAEFLTRATGLENTARFIQGDVCSMPFDDGEFDCVWSQHTLMNISDKDAAFREYIRVLKPGGILVLHEVAKGPGETDIALPVPWADRKEISFLEPWADTRSRLLAENLSCRVETDLTPEAIDWWQKVKTAFEKIMDAPPRPLGPHIVFGDHGKHFGNTMSENLSNRCIQVMEAVFAKP